MIPLCAKYMMLLESPTILNVKKNLLKIQNNENALKFTDLLRNNKM